MTKQKMNVLITGGMGFIGSHLARKYVEEGHNVSILSRSDKKKQNVADIEKNIKIILKDIREIGKEDVADMDLIFHFAGTVDNYAVEEGDPYRDIDINCKGTIALLEACKNFNKKARIVMASTFFVNGNVSSLPVTPETPCNPLAIYPATRLAAEHFCKIYHSVFDMDTIIMRFTNVFGTFEQGDNKKKAGFNFMINQAVSGEELKLYRNGEFIRDYIYVDDVIDACKIIGEKGNTGQIYYVGRGEFVKFKRLIDIIGENIPGLKFTPIEPPAFHKAVGIVDFVADVSPLKNLGWVPKVSLEEGILRTIDYYKNVGKKVIK